MGIPTASCMWTVRKSICRRASIPIPSVRELLEGETRGHAIEFQVERLRDGPNLSMVIAWGGREAWFAEAAGQLRAHLDELVREKGDVAARVRVLLLLLEVEGVRIHGLTAEESGGGD